MIESGRFTDYIKSSALSSEARTILQSPIATLIGISEEIGELLNELRIFTVFDLATSRVFRNAEEILLASNSSTNLFSRYRGFSSDMIKVGGVDLDPTNAYLEPVELLEGISSSSAARFNSLLSVSTIRDLALWMPYQASKRILKATLLPEELGGYDPESPSELVPKMGEFPTKKVFYSTIVLDHFHNDAKQQELTSAIDLGDLFDGKNHGFTGISTGALISFEQAWISEGLALGDLLHSLTLAPGESTRIAIIEWSRTEGTRTTEEISQTEKLDSAISRNRSIDDIATAVANEAQSGFSRSSSYANSSSKSEADSSTGFGAGFGFLGTASQGSSKSSASSRSRASSYASSNGRRDLFSKMTQNISDSTQQNSTSARHRYASIVQEISQSESEQLSTRTVTNYNHMHALTVQYFEVIQIHRVTTRVKDVERCLFVPVTYIKDWDQDLVRKYGYLIQAFALSEKVGRSIMEKQDAVKMIPGENLANHPYFISRREDHRAALNEVRTITGDYIAEKYTDPWVLDPDFVIVDVFIFGGGQMDVKINIQLVSGETIQDSYLDSGGNSISIERIRRIFLEATWADDWDEPGELLLYLTFTKLDTITIRRIFKLKSNGFFEGKSAIYEVAYFEYTLSSDELLKHLSDNTDYYSRILWYNLDLDSMALLLSKYKYNKTPLLQLIDLEPIAFTGSHLVFRSPVDWREDERWRDFLVQKGYLKEMRPGIEDRTPIAGPTSEKERKGIGAALKMLNKRYQEVSGADDSHNYYVDSNELISHDIIPLPSSGVFAEAVLGRFNSAEKLDMTRFWNWQDSPIPILPPEIAALNAESRAIDRGDVRPGSLDAPVVNIMNPPNLPDYQGMAPLLSAITSPNMFRDMSGQQYTAQLAQNALSQVTQAATEAAKQAGLNMETSAKLMSDIISAVVPAVSSAMGVPSGGGGGGSAFNKDAPGGKNISNAGAMINHGAKLDEKPGTTPNPSYQRGSGASGNGGTYDNTSATGNLQPVYTNTTSSGRGGSHEVEAFRTVGGGYGQTSSPTPAGAEVTLASYPESSEESHDGYGVLARPPESIEKAKNLLLRAMEENLSLVKEGISTAENPIRPGDRFADYIVIYPYTHLIAYLDSNDVLHSVRPEIFIRQSSIQSWTTGALRSQWIADATQAEVEFILGLLLNTWQILGYRLMQFIGWAYEYPEYRKVLYESFPIIARGLSWLVRKKPSMVVCIIGELFRNIPSSVEKIEAKAWAYYLARIIRSIGLSVVNRDPFSKAILSLSMVLSAFVALKAIPAAGEQTVETKIQELKSNLSSEGIEVEESCLKENLIELLNDSASEENLRLLLENMQALTPALQSLAKAVGPGVTI